MRYVTEDELRGAYARERFDSYELAADERLTPSARQFLVDFHIALSCDGQDGPATAHASEPGAKAAAAEELAVSFADDARVLGARLRLVGRRALCLERDCARTCDEVGRAWQGPYEGHGAPSDGKDGDVGSETTGDRPMPALSAEVHPVYFELALLDAELARAARFWSASRTGLPEGEQDHLDAWLSGVARVRDCLGHALEARAGEV